MNSTYSTFRMMARHEREGRDFRIRTVLRPSNCLVMAPHGGKIEPVTAEIAEAIAAGDHSFYTLEGLKSSGNDSLHLASHCFDEPRALHAITRADVVLAVHGQNDARERYVMIGGLNAGLAGSVRRYLARAGFQVRPPTAGLRGVHPANICNRGRAGRGIQLEISRGLREALRRDVTQLEAFAAAVRQAVAPGS
jgi:phage replication-related protein YjqB (UPF0714/DUF867 family)